MRPCWYWWSPLVLETITMSVANPVPSDHGNVHGLCYSWGPCYSLVHPVHVDICGPFCSQGPYSGPSSVVQPEAVWMSIMSETSLMSLNCAGTMLISMVAIMGSTLQDASVDHASLYGLCSQWKPWSCCYWQL